MGLQNDQLTSVAKSLAAARCEAMAMPRALVVDDEAAQRELLGGFLRHLGYDVVEAADGVEALSHAREGRFDIALLDQRMPRLGGIDAIRPLKELQPNLAIVVVTAFGASDAASRALQAGAAAYLSKPLDLSQLQRVMHEALSPLPS